MSSNPRSLSAVMVSLRGTSWPAFRAPTHEQVTVVDVTSQWVGFQAAMIMKSAVPCSSRLVIPIQAGAHYRIVDGKITI